MIRHKVPKLTKQRLVIFPKFYHVGVSKASLSLNLHSASGALTNDASKNKSINAVTVFFLIFLLVGLK